jgi:hypothetical protein
VAKGAMPGILMKGWEIIYYFSYYGYGFFGGDLQVAKTNIKRNYAMIAKKTINE